MSSAASMQAACLLRVLHRTCVSQHLKGLASLHEFLPRPYYPEAELGYEADSSLLTVKDGV